MRFFLDSAHIEDLHPFLEMGLIDGVTTNPTLIAKSGKNVEDVIAQFCSKVDGPVSVEVMSKSAQDMIEEGKRLSEIAENVTIKLPLTIEGLKACNALNASDIMTNVTLCFSPSQALLAAKAGATFVSPFVGRLDDIGYDGTQLIDDIVKIFSVHMLETMVLAASIRHPIHVIDVAKAGADIATLPAKVLYQMIQHPLTDKGLEIFEKDWSNRK
ncbi:MAG: Transaldolase [Holosporales bacterium]